MGIAIERGGGMKFFRYCRRTWSRQFIEVQRPEGLPPNKLLGARRYGRNSNEQTRLDAMAKLQDKIIPALRGGNLRADRKT